MSSIYYQIKTTNIDNDDIESYFPDYAISQDYEAFQYQPFTYESADKYINLNAPGEYDLFEIQSSEGVNVAFYNQAGTTLEKEFTGVTNLIIKGANMTSTIKVRNISGETASGFFRIIAEEDIA